MTQNFLITYRNTLKRIAKWPGARAYKKKMMYNVSLIYRFEPENESKKKEMLESWAAAFEEIDAIVKENKEMLENPKKA